MAEVESTLTRHDLEAKIAKRCWKDEAFRKEFTADPAGAFVKYLEAPATSLPKIVVHEETPGSWHLVLPAKPAIADELSEADLERVAGGVPTSEVSLALSSVTVATSALISSAAILGSSMASGITASAVVTVDRGW
jgi:tRNA A37 threonylcarbamoyladenosine synthetase subunit TsaC/SUA5/YrdC